MAGATHIPDVVSDRVDEVDGPAIVLTGEGDDTLRQGNTKTVRPHVVEALRLLLLQVLCHFIDGQLKLGGLTQEH